MFVVSERFLSSIVDEYGEHSVSTDGGGTWYPQQACRFLKLDHHIHSLIKVKVGSVNSCVKCMLMFSCKIIVFV